MEKTTNEDLVAEIRKLTDADRDEDRQRLQHLKDQLFYRNQEKILRTIRHYKKSRRVTEDEVQQVCIALFEAALSYDHSKGASFDTYFSLCVRWALQEQHAFNYGYSPSVYARAKAKLNNPENYDKDEVAAAEIQLKSKKPLDETVAETCGAVEVEDIQKSVIRELRAEQVQKRLKLCTPRERQIARLLADGESENKIAEQLAITHQRVSQIKARLMDKFDDLKNFGWAAPVAILALGRRLQAKPRPTWLPNIFEAVLAAFIAHAVLLEAVGIMTLILEAAGIVGWLTIRVVERGACRVGPGLVRKLRPKIDDDEHDDLAA